MNILPKWEQDFYYKHPLGRLFGGKAREEAVLEMMQKMDYGCSFLDFGCSTGHYLEKVAGFCERSAGLDIDLEKLIEARKRAVKSEFYLLTGKKTKFSDNEFSCVLCSEVLEHMPDWQDYLSEMKRITADYLLITIPLEKGVWWKALSILGFGKESREHINELRYNDILNAMHGFKLVERRFIQTPSRRLNKILGEGGSERSSMYLAMLFEKI